MSVKASATSTTRKTNTEYKSVPRLTCGARIPNTHQPDSIQPMINWQDIDTVMLDMDGTLLDLHFDNYFWTQHLRWTARAIA